jgi:acetyl esterase/lipase
MNGFASARPARRWAARLGILALLAAGGAAVRGGEREAPRRYEVEAVRDIVYYEVEKDPDRDRHRLDVYRPKGDGAFPVLVFFHGGGWTIGSKDNYFGFYGYGTIAQCLAERGLVVVVANYRLSPRVRHPEHVKDAARAVAWACKNVEKYGGDPKRLFLGGHSAGGHLAALLVTDEKYLKDVGRGRKDVRGVIGVSGLYRVDDYDLKLALTGPGGAEWLRTEVRPFATVFGNDREVAKDASPLTHVGPGLPPFLLVNAEFDYARLPEMAGDFAAALKKNGCEVTTATVPLRTHETEVFDILHLTAEPATVDLIADFIGKHAAAPKAEAKGRP